MSGGCLDGVCGCLTVSGSYLGVSGRCLGEYRWHINHIEVVISSYCLFSQWPPINQKVHYFGVSVGCLEDVWKMSWGCLGDSGWFYNWPEQKIWGKTWRNVILVYLEFVFWIVWKVPGGCLEGVWGCLEGVWKALGGNWNMFGKYQCQINW